MYVCEYLQLGCWSKITCMHKLIRGLYIGSAAHGRFRITTTGLLIHHTQHKTGFHIITFQAGSRKVYTECVRHIPASIKSGGAYKPENSAFYSTFARQLCDDTHLPGWLSTFPVHSEHSSPLRKALHIQIAYHHIQ